MASFAIPLARGGVALIKATDNGDGTYSPEVVAVASSGVLTSIRVPIVGGQEVSLAAYLDNGVYTLCAISV